MSPYKLEAILRHYCEFRELYERNGVEEITLDDGIVVNIHDVLRGISDIPPRQRQALVLTCLLNLKEVEAAPLMGFQRWTSPVSSYKKIALQKLCDRYWQPDDDDSEDLPA